MEQTAKLMMEVMRLNSKLVKGLKECRARGGPPRIRRCVRVSRVQGMASRPPICVLHDLSSALPTECLMLRVVSVYMSPCGCAGAYVSFSEYSVPTCSIS